MKKIFFAFAAALFALSAHATTLVTNGNFETRSLSGWTLSGNQNYSTVTASNGLSGSSYAWSDGAIGSLASLSQTLATAAGTLYDLSFDVASTGTNTQIFDAIFGSSTVYSFTNTTLDWTHVVVTGLLATSNLTTLTFAIQNDPSYTLLDNISVVAENAVPEPATLAIMLTGLVLIAGLRRQRRS